MFSRLYDGGRQGRHRELPHGKVKGSRKGKEQWEHCSRRTIFLASSRGFNPVSACPGVLSPFPLMSVAVDQTSKGQSVIMIRIDSTSFRRQLDHETLCRSMYSDQDSCTRVSRAFEPRGLLWVSSTYIELLTREGLPLDLRGLALCLRS